MTTQSPVELIQAALPELPKKAFQMGGKGHSDAAMRSYALASLSAARQEVEGLREALKYARRMVKPSECDVAFIDAALNTQGAKE